MKMNLKSIDCLYGHTLASLKSTSTGGWVSLSLVTGCDFTFSKLSGSNNSTPRWDLESFSVSFRL